MSRLIHLLWQMPSLIAYFGRPLNPLCVPLVNFFGINLSAYSNCKLWDKRMTFLHFCYATELEYLHELFYTWVWSLTWYRDILIKHLIRARKRIFCSTNVENFISATFASVGCRQIFCITTFVISLVIL
jgi:hypothetical protein